MNTVSRYVLVEVVKVFLVSLVCFTTLVLVIGVMREVIDEGLGVKQVVLLAPYILPDALRFTIPATMLLAASCVFGRMSGSNEVVALKSLGISPWRILWPTYVLALALSLVAVWLNDVAVSWGRGGVQRVVIGAVEEIVLNRLEKERHYSTRTFSVIVQDVRGRRLIEPVFTFQDRGKDRLVTLRCREAELSSNDQFLTLTCYSGAVDIDGETSYEFPDSYEYREFDLETLRGGRERFSSSNCPLSEIYRRLRRQPLLIDEMESRWAARAALHMISGDYSALAERSWSVPRAVREKQYDLLHRLQTEPPRRWSNGFSCLCFALIGSVMAIRRRNASVLGSFFVCFLPILIVYYPLLAFGVDRAKDGAVPPYMVWMGNAVLILWGLWLLRKVLRY